MSRLRRCVCCPYPCVWKTTSPNACFTVSLAHLPVSKQDDDMPSDDVDNDVQPWSGRAIGQKRLSSHRGSFHPRKQKPHRLASVFPNRNSGQTQLVKHALSGQDGKTTPKITNFAEVTPFRHNSSMKSPFIQEFGVAKSLQN